MKNNKKIVFFVDHKHRDLLSTIKISNYLKKKKFIIKIAPQWKFNVVNIFNPKFIVLGKNNIHDFEKIRWKLEGRKIICIPNENFHLKNIDKIDVTCHLNFYWNENTKRQQKIDAQKIVLGNPRTDFIKKNKNISKKKIITFALPPSKNDLKETSDLLNFSKAMQKKILKRDQSVLAFEEIVRGRNIVNKIIDWAPRLSKKFKDIEFHLKPHPNDNIFYWLNIKKKFRKIKNFKIIYGIDIFTFLKKSKLHIASEGCTTVFESIFSGIPTAEIISNINTSRRMFFNHQLKLCINKINDLNDIKFFSSKINNGKKFQSTKNNLLNNYIVNNLYTVDKKRCKSYADAIYNFSNQQVENNKIKNFTDLLFEMIKIKKFIYFKFFFKLFIKKIFNYKLDYPKFNHIKVNKLTRIDKTGRYDSRVNELDIIKARR